MPTTSNVHTERVFENELCAQLEANGWSVKTHPKQASSYSKEYAILAEDLLAFVQETQPTEWAKFKKWHNGQSDAVFVKRVAKQLDSRMNRTARCVTPSLLSGQHRSNRN